MNHPVYVDLIYRGMDATTPAAQETIARQLAVEFRVTVEEIRHLLQQVDMPLRTQLIPAAAEILAERLAKMGLQVELVAAEAKESTLESPAARFDLTIPCRRCRREIAVEVAVCPFCGTAVAGAGHPARIAEWQREDPTAAAPLPRPRWQVFALVALPAVVVLAGGIGVWRYIRHASPPAPVETSSLPIPVLPAGQVFAAETHMLLDTLRDMETTAQETGNLATFERLVSIGQERVGQYLQRWPGAPHPLDPTTAELLRRQLTRTLGVYADARDLWRLRRQRAYLALTDPDVEPFLERYPGLRRRRFHPPSAPAGIDYLQMPEALHVLWEEGAGHLNRLEKLVQTALPARET